MLYEAIIMAAICLGVKLDYHMKIRKYTEGVRGRGAEENMWTSQGNVIRS
jgi:hypothetical protein